MPVCRYCGGEIEFRWIDGGPKPIHLSGGWCTGYESNGGIDTTSRPSPRHAPASRASADWTVGHARCDLGVRLTHPTSCPICGAFIFFHTNGNGDCVFFDELGPPWPKHACLSTDAGTRTASRSTELMRLVDLVARPSRIPTPLGVRVQEFTPEKVGHSVIGVVLTMKPKKVWRQVHTTAVRQPLQVLALTLQLGSHEAVRVHVPVDAPPEIGQMVQLVLREEVLDGRSAFYADSWAVSEPP